MVQFLCAPRGAGVLLNISATFWRNSGDLPTRYRAGGATPEPLPDKRRRDRPSRRGPSSTRMHGVRRRFVRAGDQLRIRAETVDVDARPRKNLDGAAPQARRRPPKTSGTTTLRTRRPRTPATLAEIASFGPDFATSFKRMPPALSNAAKKSAEAVLVMAERMVSAPKGTAGRRRSRTSATGPRTWRPWSSCRTPMQRTARRSWRPARTAGPRTGFLPRGKSTTGSR